MQTLGVNTLMTWDNLVDGMKTITKALGPTHYKIKETDGDGVTSDKYMKGKSKGSREMLDNDLVDCSTE